MIDGDPLVLSWWAALSLVGCMNVVLSCWRYWSLGAANRSRVAFVGVVYSACCAFRSVWPRIDVERVCFWESPLSYIAVGRTVATVAEVSFGFQLAELVRSLSASGGKPSAGVSLVGGLVGPSIGWLSVVANTSCWIAVLTRHQLFHAVEESLWLLIGVALLVSFVVVALNQPPRRLRPVLYGGAALAAVYVLFMLLVDVPMYVHKWRADEAAAGARYLSLAEGAVDSFGCRSVDRTLAFWAKEMPWLTGYFTVAVWASIYLMRSFRPHDANKHQ